MDMLLAVAWCKIRLNASAYGLSLQQDFVPSQHIHRASGLAEYEIFRRFYSDDKAELM